MKSSGTRRRPRPTKQTAARRKRTSHETAVFISYSGRRSFLLAKAIASIARRFMPNAPTRLFAPPSGSTLYKDLLEELDRPEAVICCMTPENIESPWIHFEAGAICTRRQVGRVIPLVFEVDRDRLPFPLSLFTAQTADGAGVAQLFVDLARTLGQAAPDRRAIEGAWERLLPNSDKRMASSEDLLDQNNPAHVAVRKRLEEIERMNRPLRHYIARDILNRAFEAYKQIANRQAGLRYPNKLTDEVGDALKSAVRARALCGGKPWPKQVRHRYYQQCFDFAARMSAVSTELSVIRMFPEPAGKRFPTDDWPVLMEHHRRRSSGVRPMIFSPTMKGLSPEVRKLAVDMVNDGMGFILIERPEGSVAFSHRGKGATFHASRWDDPYCLAAMRDVLDELQAVAREFNPKHWANSPRSGTWRT